MAIRREYFKGGIKALCIAMCRSSPFSWPFYGRLKRAKLVTCSGHWLLDYWNFVLVSFGVPQWETCMHLDRSLGRPQLHNGMGWTWWLWWMKTSIRIVYLHQRRLGLEKTITQEPMQENYCGFMSSLFYKVRPCLPQKSKTKPNLPNREEQHLKVIIINV